METRSYKYDFNFQGKEMVFMMYLRSESISNMVSEGVECVVDNWLQCFVLVVQKRKLEKEDGEGKK